ncbi:phage tail protein [Sphingomonas immobilis]|nr:phage tail protein [Sphingomonas sp. CA1-15]
MIMAPTPARADPISAAVLAFLGTQTATALALAVTTFLLTTAASLVLGLVAGALFGPKNNAQDRQASVAQMTIGENPREGILGEVGTGGSLADAFNDGGTDGTDYETLVIDVGDHRCHSLTGFYVGDVYVAFTGSGIVPGYNNQLEVYWLEGTEDQVMPACVTSFGGWDADSNLAGCAVVVVRYKADKPDAKNPIWTAGRPNFLWVVKGKLCYQPRKDSSIGGSGAHRWDDPSTWEWTDNLIDCRYNWVRGIYACDRIDQPGMLLVGRGLSAIEAPPERIFAYANTCDEAVALKAGGTEKRYRCNLVVRANEDYIATEEMFAAACAGVIIQVQGGVEVEPGAARSVVAEITDADFVVGESLTFNPFRTDTQRVNTVVPRYVEPTQRWVDHAAPLRRVLADLAEDGGPREETLTLTAVTSGTQAQRCGEIRRRLARLERSATVVLGPRFSHLEEGDWIAWTSVRHLKGERVVFRVSSYNLAESWRNTLAIEEISASCYSWTAAVDELVPGAVAEQQTPPVRAAPSGSDWALAGATLTSAGGSIPAIVFTGASGNAYAEQIVFEYRLDGGTDADWIDTGLATPSVTRREVTSVSPGADYEGAVSYVIGGTPTDRLVLGPVTAGDLGAPGASRGAYRLTGQSVDYPLTSNDTTITISTFSGLLDDGSTITFPAGSIGSLTGSTNYGVFWSISGSSYSVEADPALTSLANPDLVFLGWMVTSTGGTFPTAPTPPGGFGGNGTRPKNEFA